MKFKNQMKGFTLIEIILVLAIISTLIVMGISYTQQKTEQLKIDKTVAQINQILNAALSYYVANGKWPNTANDLNNTYVTGIPIDSSSQFLNPFQGHYRLLTRGSRFVVNASMYGKQIFATAANVASRIPMGFTESNYSACTTSSTQCDAEGSVNPPGLNISNATAVNASNLYHNGACVPVPDCPTDPVSGKQLNPEIMAVPVSVSGVNDQSNQNNVYPISSFTAYAQGNTPLDATPPKCQTDTGFDNGCYSDQQKGSKMTGRFWRVCLQVITQKGQVQWGTDTSSNNWGKYATILAMTRCALPQEPTGSNFTVWAP